MLPKLSSASRGDDVKVESKDLCLGTFLVPSRIFFSVADKTHGIVAEYPTQKRKDRIRKTKSVWDISLSDANG